MIPRARTTYQQAPSAGRARRVAERDGHRRHRDVRRTVRRSAIGALPAAAKRDEDQQNILGAASKVVALAEAHQARGNGAAQQTSIRRRARCQIRRACSCPRPGSRLPRASRRGAAIAADSPAPLRPEPRLREDDRRGNRDRREAIRRGRRGAQRRTEAGGPVARPLRAGPRLLPSWRLPRSRVGIREMPRAAGRSDGGFPRRPRSR